MPYIPSRPSPKSFWSRFAAFLSFVAVLSALLAPVSMLAQDVQSGKLGGICSLNNFAASNVDDGAATGGSEEAKASHCDMCGSPGVVLPLLALLVIPTFAGSEVAAVFLPADKAAFVAGLPFSRGPPSSL